jgi:hypothetical protein
MPTMAEILAAKRNKTATTSAPAQETPVQEVKEEVKEEQKKEEVASAPSPKSLSFAEKMLLKKQQETAQAQNTPVAQAVKQLEEKPAPIPAKEDTGITTTEQPSTEIDPVAVDPVVAQAYSDIKEKIERLSLASDTDLKSAMKDLKAALMKNPAAVSLMEDTDIGQMVIALRKITGEALAEAAKEKKPGRKAKENVDLSDPDKVAAIFDEL